MTVDLLARGSATALPADYRRKVLSLRRRRNWDGEDANPITAAACRAALEFVGLVLSKQPGLPLPRPAPSVIGAVSLFWSHDEEGLLVDISSDDPMKVSFHWEGSGGRSRDGAGHRDEVVERVLSLYRTQLTDE
jgi:hypothetical protein